MKSYLFLFNFMSPFSRKKLYGGECYDKRHVWARIVAVTIPAKLPCGLRGRFYQ
jgi:hypothetical protein